ncbi:related to endoglucanase [Phialocephala subalpina]|uniref:Related to endoglucanase n=1 Tax=Phialocephala subalpina TaxID=576137 RepID=A0A1L7X927_9HELO|nr:related to endoglucanase [Phialocephala subalpina]
MHSLLFLGSFLLSTVSGYTWKNVKIGGGGGFTPGIVFNPTEKGVAYARTDIGGLYRLNADDSWTPLTDYANDTTWHDWGVDALATDPIDARRVYITVGMYTNSWDPNNASVMRSQDYGKTWSRTPLPFKAGGNQPGRGMGERLAIDPNNNKIIYFGARSGNGLWKSVDQGLSFQKVTSFTAVGTYVADSTDTSGYNNDIDGLAAITFDSTSPLKNGSTSRIYVGTADRDSSTWVSNDAGETWTAMVGQPTGVFPHKMKFSKEEKALYISYNSESGPYSAGFGYVYHVSSNGTFTNITPAWAAKNSVTIGYGGLALDTQKPGTLMVAAMNLWAPDVQIFRSTDSGATWTTIWDYVNGTQTKYYTQDTNLAPWINNQRQPGDTKILGWMLESLEINPFDSQHFLYGTGVTIYGSHNLESWPKIHISSLADGIEEESVQNLISPPGISIPLISAVGDDGGFVHYDLDKVPENSFVDPFWSTTTALDYAGLAPKNVLRIGNSQLATSTDAGKNWTLVSSAPSTASGGAIAYAADASAIVWASSAGSLRVASNSITTISSLPSNAAVVADRVNPAYFYAGDTTGVLVSKDGGKTFTRTVNVTSYGGVKMAAHPATAGDVWLSTDLGIYHSTNFGSTFTQSPSVTGANAIAVGRGAGNGTNVYSFNTIGGVAALRLTSDVGKTWSTISDAEHGFASASANCLAASWETPGLVFVGTNGRGVFYGLP